MRALFLNRLMAYVLAAALSMQAFIPIGFMPDLSALQRGVVTIKICSASGPKEIAFGGQQDEQKNTGKHTNNSCPFAAVQRTATPTPEIMLAARVFSRIIAPPPTVEIFQRKEIKTALWARGPPSLS